MSDPVADEAVPGHHRTVALAILFAALSASVCTTAARLSAEGRTETVHVGDKLPRFSMLKPGVHRYLRYKIQDEHRTILDIWTREIRYDVKDGRRLLHSVQEWDGAGTDQYMLAIDAWFEPDTFRPLTFVKRLTRAGQTTIGGYRFFPDRIVGMAELEGNSRRDFTQASPEPAYNFETDIELLQTLPFAEGYAVNLPFYDPGLDPPARYTFKASGSDRIAAADGRSIDCWVVTADYNKPDAVPTRFWFARSNQVLVREESRLRDNAVLIKTLLNDEAMMPTPDRSTVSSVQESHEAR